MSTQPDRTPHATAEAPDKGVGCDALLALLRNAEKHERVFYSPQAPNGLPFLLGQAIATIERQAKAIVAVSALIDESHGVAGLHLNGDVAPWHDLREGGRYEEWLIDFDAALANKADKPT